MTGLPVRNGSDLAPHNFPRAGLRLIQPAGVRLRRRLAALAGLLTLTLAVGCASLPPSNLQPPEVVLADIGLTEIGLSEIRFEVVIEARNPNDVDMPMTNIRADLDLFGVPFATGVAPVGTVYLPKRGVQYVPMVFRVSTLRVLDSVRQARGMDWSKFSYRVRGTANWADSAVTLPFGREGSLEVIKRAIEVFGRR